jgi:hypothetical protein
MLMVDAPSLITASMMRQRKSSSDRPASSQENSTSSMPLRAKRTACRAATRTSSGAMRSFFSMWIGLVAMKVWMRPDFAGLTASSARAMSLSKARHRPQTVESLMASATALTASKSPLDAAGNPASMTSTRMRSSWRAMRSFSSLVMEAPGLCSPSRKVVSKMIKCSLDMVISSSGRLLSVAAVGESQKAKSTPPLRGQALCTTGLWGGCI